VGEVRVNPHTPHIRLFMYCIIYRNPHYGNLHYNKSIVYSRTVIFFQITVILSGIIPFGIIPPPFVSPPERQDGLRCDIVCQVITLPNHPTGQDISLLLTHIVDLYPFGYKTIPSVNNYTRSGVVPHFSTMICLHEVGV
jgi:hypothetical protein